jgi:WD40 repeat protein
MKRKSGLPKGFWWGLFAALVALILAIWWLPARPDREWAVPDKSRVVGFYGDAIATWEQVEEGKTSLWHAHTGQLLAEIPGLASSLHSAFSPDGRFLVYGEKQDSGWVLRVHNLATSKREQDLIIRLPEKMNRLAGNSFVTLLIFSEHGDRLIYREEDEQGYWRCLWDLQQRKLIHRQPYGLYHDTNLILRFEKSDNVYSVWSSATGQLLGKLPPLEAATEFEYSASPDGSAVMILTGTNDARLIKYRFDVATHKLTTMWQRQFGPGTHAVYYEFTLRPPLAYVIKERLAHTHYLLDAHTGEQKNIPYDLTGAWADSGVNSLRFDFGENARGDTSIFAVDTHGTRIISPNGRYLIYVIQDDFTGWMRWLDDWLTRIHLPLSRNSHLIVVDVPQGRMIDDFPFKPPFADFTVPILHFAPSSNQIAFVNYKSQQAYLQFWSIPFPSRPWWLIILISIAAGVVVWRLVSLIYPKQSQAEALRAV